MNTCTQPPPSLVPGCLPPPLQAHPATQPDPKASLGSPRRPPGLQGPREREESLQGAQEITSVSRQLRGTRLPSRVSSYLTTEVPRAGSLTSPGSGGRERSGAPGESLRGSVENPSASGAGEAPVRLQDLCGAALQGALQRGRSCALSRARGTQGRGRPLRGTLPAAANVWHQLSPTPSPEGAAGRRAPASRHCLPQGRDVGCMELPSCILDQPTVGPSDRSLAVNSASPEASPARTYSDTTSVAPRVPAGSPQRDQTRGEKAPPIAPPSPATAADRCTRGGAQGRRPDGGGRQGTRERGSRLRPGPGCPSLARQAASAPPAGETEVPRRGRKVTSKKTGGCGGGVTRQRSPSG